MSKGARCGSPDEGDSLVEVLVSVTVLSIGVISLVTALQTNVTATVINRDQAQLETLVLSEAEYVKSIPLTAALCTAAAPFDTSAVPRPIGYTVTFGTLTGFQGQSCSKLASVAIAVSGNGFSLPPVTVVKRS